MPNIDNGRTQIIAASVAAVAAYIMFYGLLYFRSGPIYPWVDLGRLAAIVLLSTLVLRRKRIARWILALWFIVSGLVGVLTVLQIRGSSVEAVAVVVYASTFVAAGLILALSRDISVYVNGIGDDYK